MSTDDTVREVEVDELAEAERYLREICDASPGFTAGRLGRVLAEYDRRGAIEQRARHMTEQGHGWMPVERAAARHILGEA